MSVSTSVGGTLVTWSNCFVDGFHFFKNIVVLNTRESFGSGFGLEKLTGGISGLFVPNVTVV